MDEKFDATRYCCYCGEDNSNDTAGYAGERCCHHCGKGGDGSHDDEVMAYKGNLPKKLQHEAR